MTREGEPSDKAQNWKFPDTTNQPETSRENESSIKVLSYLDSISSEELGNRVAEQIRSSDVRSASVKLEFLELASDASEDEIKEALQKHIERYKERVKQVQEMIPAQLARTNEWLNKNGYRPKQSIDSVSVIVSDRLLQSGFPDGTYKNILEEFDPITNQVSVSGQEHGNFLAHEYIHAISHNVSTKETGFRQVAENGALVGNQWLDEGMAVLGEMATFPNARVERHYSDNLYLEGYLWMTRLFMKELNLSESDLFKAYFDQDTYRSMLETKVKQRFGCSVADLDDLFLGYLDEDKEIIQKILNKEPIVLSAMEGSGIDKKYLRLKKIFPAIRVDIQKRPVLSE